MSASEARLHTEAAIEESRPSKSAKDGKLHRLRAVRREQGITARRMAQHLQLDVDEVARQEDESCDLTLSQLYAWQRILEVPVADLLVDSDAALSAPVLQRARLVRLMKTAAAILERADTSSMRRLAEALVNQLTEIMPELEGITPWCSESSRAPRRQLPREPRHTISSKHWQEA